MEPIGKPKIDMMTLNASSLKCMLRSGELGVYDALQLIANDVKRHESDINAETDEVRRSVEELRRLVEELNSEIPDVSQHNPVNRREWKEKPVKEYVKDDVVFHMGCSWICNKDGTEEEPSWLSDDWTYMMGDCQLSIDMRSTDGIMFRKGNLLTTLVCSVMFGSFDVTRKVLRHGAVGIQWTRDTGNEVMDNSWVPYQTIPEDQTSINLRVTNYDVGYDFWDRRKTKFTLSMQIPTSSGYKEITREINIKI